MRSREITGILDTGRPRRGDRMLVFVVPGSGRVAVVAGKRLGGAVRRNRARRVLRAAWSEVGPCAERDVVVVARSGIVGAKTQELVTEMSRLVAEAEPR